MRQIKFTEEEIKQLRYESIYHEHALVRRRMQALLLKSDEMPHAKIGERLGICPTTLRKYFDLFLSGAETRRVEALKKRNYKGKPNRLMEKRDEIIRHLEENPPATLKEAQARIKDLTGIQRSWPQVREFRRRKVKQIPAKTDIEAQEIFKTETLEPLVEQAKPKKSIFSL